MPDEDSIEIPDAWRFAVHPRRSGMRPLLRPITDADREQLAVRRRARAAECEAILTNPGSDPRLVRAVRDPSTSIEAEGARLALERATLWLPVGSALIDSYVQRLGLPLAAAACVESASVATVVGGIQVPGIVATAFVRHTEQSMTDPDAAQAQLTYDEVPDHLRRLLATADDATYAATVTLLEPFRRGLYAQRIITSYLLPDRRDWVAADFAKVPSGYRGSLRLLQLSAYEADQLGDWTARNLDEFVTTWDSLGEQAIPLLLRWFSWPSNDRETRLDAIDVLKRIPSDVTFGALLARIHQSDVPSAVVAAADRFPSRALRLIAPLRNDLLVAELLARHGRAHPDLPGASDFAVERPPVAANDQLPLLLTSPPWTRPGPERFEVPSPDGGPSIHWQANERNEIWSWDRWGVYTERDWEEFLRKDGSVARFFVGGPEHLVRPRLASWPAENASFYLENPRVIVAKYELDALPPMLRLAQRKPIVGAHLLLPFRSTEVAALMASWLASSRQFRPIAQQWFDRHGVDGVTLVLPTALGGQPAESRVAATALARLDPNLVRAAGDALGCAAAVEAFLARDPLDLIPGKVPTVPSWLDLDDLPPVLLRDGEHALPTNAVDALCRMIAMSQLDSPYEGLRVVADACDKASLAAFAWSLYCSWQLAERPSKDAWAMNALGYFGDDATADRLAVLVRAWPHEGAAARAKRGADLLGIMRSDHALQLLGAIARNAKSTPLRVHAGEALDRVSVERGLLPEQLEDLVAPDLGLGGDPVTYRGIDYVVELGEPLSLVLRAPDGTVTAKLAPPVDDDEQAVVTAWNRRRKQAKAVLADQVRRLEEAMIVQRRWTPDEFADSIVGHPLLGQLARRLVWSLDGTTAVVDGLGDLVGPEGGLVPPGQWVSLAHPAASHLSTWSGWRASRGIDQPFAQLDREAHDGDPSLHWNRTVSAASLYGLIRRGWHWGPTGHGGSRSHLLRPLGGAGAVLLTFEPGLYAAQNPAKEPAQTIVSLSLESPEHPGVGVFGDLHRVTRSELLADLATLT